MVCFNEPEGTAHTFSSGDVVTVESGNISDTFTFE